MSSKLAAVLALVLAVELASCASHKSNTNQAAAAGPVAFTTQLDGQQETPSVVTSASGTGQITFDGASRTLMWDISYQGLSSRATAAHFHGPARPGAKAGVQVPLDPSPDTGRIQGQAQLTPEQADQLLAGQWYVNVHSERYPDGEIRGQVEPSSM
jgi:hypothetical protein